MALAIDGAVVERRFLTTPKAHASGVIEATRDALERAGVGVGDLVGVAVGSGPGSFTGLRVAGAAAMGLAGTLEIPMYATSSLRAASVGGEILPASAVRPSEVGPSIPLERSAREAAERRYVLFDARRDRVYGASYQVGAQGAVEAIPPHGGTIDDALRAARDRGPAVFMGDGAAAHRDRILEAGHAWRPWPAGLPLADGALATCAWEPIAADAWEPEYVREWRPG